MASSEDEIYSIMFTSLKHPVRRKILRMLGEKPMTFMELVEQLGVSTSHLTYHLESLGELVSKLDNNQYKLSTFGLATVSAMRGVEEASPVEPKRRLLSFKWKAVIGALLVVVLVLAAFSVMQVESMNQISNTQKTLSREYSQLASWGFGTDKVVDFIQNVTQISTANYTVTMAPSTLTWRTDFGGVAEETMQYSLTSSTSNLNLEFRFRDDHFSRYALSEIESSPIFVTAQPTDVLQNANETLARYYAFSGDSYLVNMTNLLNTVTQVENENVTQGNMLLEITVSGGTVTFFWMFTDNGIDYQTKGLEMVFQNDVLMTMTDGYFLFTIGSTDLSISQGQALTIAKNYVKGMTWTIAGTQVSGFNVVDPPVSVQLVPHTRGNSVALIPYWYIEMSLTMTYPGGYNEVTIGIYGDTGQVADVQLLASTAT